ncbi:MAG: S-layer homology domain-containing protein [Evtepia gabavorous]
MSGGSAFTDVENGAWYADAVAWAAANDIVNGTSATTFAPTAPSPGSKWRRSCTGMPPTRAMT